MFIARILGLALAALVTVAPIAPAQAQSQSHVALIIGNSAYAGGQLPTPNGDAAVVAETMRAAGYDVTEVDDVRAADIGAVMRTFLDKVTAAGPEAVAFFYYAGQAAQAGSENYLVPVDAQIGGIGDVPAQSLRLNDLVDALAALPAAARIVVLDASHDHGYGRGTPAAVPPGLAIMEAPAGTLIAFAAAPGQIAPESGTQYSLYTATLVSLMRQPGLDLDQIFKTARAQVNQVTGGKQTPWTAMGLAAQVMLFPAEPAVVPQPLQPPIVPANNAPPAPTVPPKGERTVTKGMLSRLSPDDAYTVAIEEDSLQVYQWFVELFPQYQYAGQIWDVITSRRDELLWQRAVAVNTRNGYWNYLDRFPNGIHAAEAQQALASMTAPVRPPPTYVPQPVPLPPDYYDEGMDVGEIVPYGDQPPPSVFDLLAPLFLPPPPPPPPFFFPPRPPRIVLPPAPPVLVTPPPVVVPPKHVSIDGATPPNKHTGVRPPDLPPPPTTHGPKNIGPTKPTTTTTTPTIPPTTHGPHPPVVTPPPGPHGTPVTPPTIPPGPGPHGTPPTVTTPTIPPGPGPHGTPVTPPTIPPAPGPHGTPPTVTTPTIPPGPGPHGTPVTPPTIPPVPGPHGTPPAVTTPTIPPGPGPHGTPVTPPTIPPVPGPHGTPPTVTTPTIPPVPGPHGTPPTVTTPTIPPVPGPHGTPPAVTTPTIPPVPGPHGTPPTVTTPVVTPPKPPGPGLPPSPTVTPSPPPPHPVMPPPTITGPRPPGPGLPPSPPVHPVAPPSPPPAVVHPPSPPPPVVAHPPPPAVVHPPSPPPAVVHPPAPPPVIKPPPRPPSPPPVVHAPPPRPTPPPVVHAPPPRPPSPPPVVHA
ncbi:MAG: caspase family protein, partial [Xanthobacteraceae bacterium]|nr:caspase family protein [Xanthobacteraceae bacterium]